MLYLKFGLISNILHRFTYLLPAAANPYTRIKPSYHHSSSHHPSSHHHGSSRAPVYTIPAAALSGTAKGGGGGRSARHSAHYLSSTLFPGQSAAAPHYLYKDYSTNAAGSNGTAAAAASKGILPRSARLDRDRSAWQRPYTPSDYIF